MSDDDTVPAAPGQIVEVHTDEVDSQSQDSGEPMQVSIIWQWKLKLVQVFSLKHLQINKVEELDQAGPRRRRKKVAAAADASFSSGLFPEAFVTLVKCNKIDLFLSMSCCVQEERMRILTSSFHPYQR